MGDKVKTLTDLRVEIDEVDRQIHRLLIKRAELSHQVGDLKTEAGLPIVNAAREAEVVRALINRHAGDLPMASLIAIWRELIGASVQIQQVTPVVIAGGGNDAVAMDLARSYFGSATPIEIVASSLNALSRLRDGSAGFVVLPWPDDEDAQSWWPHLVQDGGPAIRIVARLPYDEGVVNPAIDHEARYIIVGDVPYFSSGNDHSFVCMNLVGEISRSRLNSLFDEAGLGIVALHRRGDGLHLIEVSDYVDDTHAGMKKLVSSLGEVYAWHKVIGGFALLGA